MRVLSSTMACPSVNATAWFGLRPHSIATSCGVPLRSKLEKVLEDEVAVFGRDAFGVELHAMNRQGLMLQPHHKIIRLRAHRQIPRHARALDDERMIARCLE